LGGVVLKKGPDPCIRGVARDQRGKQQAQNRGIPRNKPKGETGKLIISGGGGGEISGFNFRR